MVLSKQAGLLRQPVYSLLVATCCVLSWSLIAQAQFGQPSEPTVSSRISTRGPHYVGESVRVQVQAEGFSQEDEPSCTPMGPLPEGMTFLGMTPQHSSFTSIINGKRTSRVIANYIFIYEFVGQKPGVRSIPAFEVATSDRKYRTRPLRVQLQEVPIDPRLRVKVVMPERALYVGQEVPIKIEWWTENALFERRGEQSLQVPLLKLSSDFKLAYDAPTTRRDQAIHINGDDGLQVKVTAERRKDGDTTYVVVTAPITLIPLRAGKFSPAPASLTLLEVTGYRRTMFGREPASTRKIGVFDLPRTIEILDLPTQGRPASFAGALGTGFTLNVRAERTVVQVGEPVKLTVALSGDGSLETAGPPRFAEGGLAPSQFRVRSDNLAGTIAENTKTFEVNVRILDASVREIPPIEYSWFDPTRQEYRSTTSQPIALRVKEGRTVTAADVEQSQPIETELETTEVESVPMPGDGDRPRFTLTGASLSLLDEDDVGGLLSFATPTNTLLLHTLPLLALVLAIFGRRRASIDPEIGRRKQLFSDQIRAIDGAASRPPREAARAIAAALRAMVAESDRAQRPGDVDDLIATCDAVVFAPEDRTPELAPELVARSREIARTLAEGGGAK